jgi:hypothetical protein
VRVHHNVPMAVTFPRGGDGKRSTTATGRAIFADSVREVDPPLSDRIEHTKDWRKGYITPMREIVVSASRTPQAAIAISRAGLESTHRRFTFTRNGEDLPLGQVMNNPPASGAIESVTVRGRASREEEFSIPYQGRRIFGSDLRRQIDKWVDTGIAEPSFGQALHLVMDNPEWLDLRDTHIAILGAGAEMAPTRSLLRWGAHIHALDLPRPEIWQRLIDITRGTPGSLRIPISPGEFGETPFTTGGNIHSEDDSTIASVAGIDLLNQPAEIAEWINQIDGRFVLGNYTYADGALHALLSVSADAIFTKLAQSRRDMTLAFLATPTDVFMVPFECVEASRARWDNRGVAGALQSPLRLFGQFEPNYPTTYFTDNGTELGLSDSLVLQQGPNYLLAKRIQRWRALVARHEGYAVSLNLAPATRTQSVVKNRALAAAYAGAGRFGVEVFEPATSTALMAAMLVHDLRNPLSTANPSTPLNNPMDLFVVGANHGGLWRAAYAPRSVLGIAAVLGMFESRA